MPFSFFPQAKMSLIGKKRKNKKKYYQSSKKSKCAGLEPGMKGFLITCNDEQRCIKEAYNLLNEFADEMYGPEFKVTNEFISNLLQTFSFNA